MDHKSLTQSAQLPSRRYDQFQTAFEKHVAEIQERIKKTGDLKRIYTIAISALEAANLSNPIQIDFSETQVDVTIEALSADQFSVFENLFLDIGSRLLRGNYHFDGIPAQAEGGSFPSIRRIWQCLDLKTLRVDIQCPVNGIAGCRFERASRKCEIYEYTRVDD